MKLKIELGAARVRGTRYQVIRPVQPVAGAVLADRNPWYVLEVGAAAAYTLTGLWLLAARSRDALVHVPLWGNLPPEPSCAITDRGELDLILSHHRQQFPARHWKELRSHLKTWSPHTVAWNPNDVPPWEQVHERNRQASQRPLPRPGLHQHIHSHTLFLAGHNEIFIRTARYILDLATWQPKPQQHSFHCATLHPADGHFTTSGQGIYLIRWK